MFRTIRTFNKRKASSDANLHQTLRNQAKDHKDFLNDMGERVWQMGPIWGGDPPRESKERTKMRSDAFKDVFQQTKDYKESIKNLMDNLGNRGDQDWTAKPRASNDVIVKHRKAAGILQLTRAKDSYEAILDAMDERETTRALGERREMRRQGREAEIRLANEKGQLLKTMSDLHAAKKAELDSIQARVNGRANGHPEHPEFKGYATAGYAPVDMSSKRLRDHAAEAADKDADHAESAAKLLCLSMPLGLRNRVVTTNHPKKQSSLLGTGISNPMEWTEMNWSQRWALLSRHAPQGAVQKAQQKSGVDTQGLDHTMTSAASTADQRTLSPRTLGLASTQ